LYAISTAINAHPNDWLSGPGGGVLGGMATKYLELQRKNKGDSSLPKAMVPSSLLETHPHKKRVNKKRVNKK
jgi:hypothetical protein